MSSPSIQPGPAANLRSRILAVLEVLFVQFVLLRLATALLVFSPVWDWQQPQRLNLLVHTVMMAVPVAWLVLNRRNLAHYGLTLLHWRADLEAALTAYLPVALGGATLGFLDYTSWGGAALESLVQVGVLIAVGWTLSRKPDPKSGVITIVLSILFLGAYGLSRGARHDAGQILLAFVTYVLFVGFGEEVLYRGFAQSRLNEAFGRPYTWFGIAWGPGLVLASLLFGCSHVLNGVNPYLGQYNPTWAWGLWTIFSGLVFGLVYEKTRSLLAPTILHGLPQAIAVACLGGMPGV